ncbi:hypothetical protein H0H92_012875 [Tricholoma furcatifolium]|nr:hypothetical protein H0H92_012875 [Tricholoma furcatifolium]
MADSVLLIIDSASSDIDYTSTGPQSGAWVVEDDQTSFNGSSTWSPQPGEGCLEVTFTGTSIAFFGQSPRAPIKSQAMTVTIDGGTSWQTRFDPQQAGSYYQWWQSPSLDEGTHTIRLDSLTETSVDYMVVSCSGSSLQAGQPVIIDDADASFVYNGSGWGEVVGTGQFEDSEGQFSVSPFQNTTHQSGNIGDSATVTFIGSSVTLYGLLPNSNAGVLSVQYTLDSSGSTTQTYQITPSTMSSDAGSSTAFQNYILYTNDSLDAGQHSLTIQISSSRNIPLVLDYLVYDSVAAPLFMSPTTQSTTQTSSAVHAVSPNPPLPALAESSHPVSSGSSKSASSTVSTTQRAPVTTSSLSRSGSTSTSPTENGELSPNVATSSAAGALHGSGGLRDGENIAIAVVSVLVIAASIAVAIILYRKWRRRAALDSEQRRSLKLRLNIGSPPPTTPITPFMLLHPSADSPAAAAASALERMNMKMESLVGAQAMLMSEKGTNIDQLDQLENNVMLPALHRRSGSGPRHANDDDESESGTLYTTMTRSSWTVRPGVPRPPSYVI